MTRHSTMHIHMHTHMLVQGYQPSGQGPLVVCGSDGTSSTGQWQVEGAAGGSRPATSADRACTKHESFCSKMSVRELSQPIEAGGVST